MSKEVKSKFTLPKEKVTVKFIKRKKGMASNVADDHVISGGMLDKAVKKYYAPMKPTGGLYNVLTNEEKEFLEKETDLKLSSYSDFWKTFCVRLFKDDASNVFDMSDPMGYISVRLLETCTKVIAPSWKKRKNAATYEFVITKVNEEFNEKKVKLDSKKEAFKLYGKIEDDKDKLLSILRILTNKPVADTTTLHWLQGKVEDYLDTMPTAFLSVIKDTSFDTKVLLSKGVSSGDILKKSNKYSTIDGLKLCENGELASYANAVRYLDNDKNQEVRSLLEARINDK